MRSIQQRVYQKRHIQKCNYGIAERNQKGDKGVLFFKIEAETVNQAIIQDDRQRDLYAAGLQPKADKFYHGHDKKVYICVSSINECRITAGLLAECAYALNHPALELFEAFLREIDVQYANIRCEEITLRSLLSLLRVSSRCNYIDDDDTVLEAFRLDKPDRSSGLGYKENLIKGDHTKEELISQSCRALLGETFSPELTRIYKGGAVKNAAGHPVHYLIETDDSKVKEFVIKSLTYALYSNNRIASRRYCEFSLNLDDLEVYSGFTRNFQSCEGCAVTINIYSEGEAEGGYALGGMDNISKICAVVRKNRNGILTIFCLPRANASLKRTLIEQIGNLTLVEIREDATTGSAARKYLARLARDASTAPDKALYDCVTDLNRVYYAKELNNSFENWYANRLKTKIYPQYAHLTRADKQAAALAPEGSAYEELNAMIGLENVKDVIARALDYFKARKIFMDRGLVNDVPSMHMVFSGNPGTAKTTVARLFARIMRDNGLLSIGELHEVGRADLVGKYVGWTARLVKEKFKAAQGSVLFIDEAYSLADNHLYGEEAVNTIVQEMENRREDIAVIFAGYPDKMEQFIQMNPGLRSRIAWHVAFNDYSPGELYSILELMVSGRRMTLGEDVRSRLIPMLDAASRRPDFGNGRYVRNLFEKARIKQARRLLAIGPEKVTNQEIDALIKDDFDCEQGLIASDKRQIGFEI
jgi:AAA+ superfamily predicted ATPase